jgi:hypothetical protein
VLDFLPAYSPNLNLIERLWKFLRKHALQQWHPSYEAMQAAVARVLDHLQDYREELAALMVERFHLVPEMPTETVPVRWCGTASTPRRALGVRTVESLRQAGGRVLAVEAGKTIILDQEETVRLADRHGISIVAR